MNAANPVIETAIHQNLSDTDTAFSIAGGGESDLGFVQLSGYLLTHPMLSVYDKLVLAYLAYRARSYTDLRDCKPVKSKANASDVERELGISRPKVIDTLSNLERLGLVVKTGGRGRAGMTIVLQPGPWPQLGDRPKKGLTWHDALVFDMKGLVKRWLGMFLNHDLTLEAARQVLQGKEPDVGLKTPSKAKEETGRILKTPKKKSGSSYRNTAEKSGISDHPASVDVSSDTISNSASGTENPAPSLARARDSIYSTKTNLQRSTTRESADANRLGGPDAPRHSNPNPSSVSKPGAVEPLRACIPETNNSPKRDLARIEADAKKLRRKPSNPRAAFEQRYLELVDEHFDISLPKFNTARKSQVKKAFTRYGAKTMADALEWLFANWRTLKANNPKFYGDDKFPPLRALTSFNLMDRYLPYVQKGEQMKSNDGEYWKQWTSDMEVGRQHEAEIDVIDQHLGGAQ